MACTAVSASTWRRRRHEWNNAKLVKELHRAWYMRPHWVGSDARTYQDWTQFRAATLREARKRGLDLSVVELGT